MNVSPKGVLWGTLWEHMVPSPLLGTILSLCETLRTVFALMVLNQVFTHWALDSAKAAVLSFHGRDHKAQSSPTECVQLGSLRITSVLFCSRDCRPRTHWSDCTAQLAWEPLRVLMEEEVEHVAGQKDGWNTLLSLLPLRADLR